MRRSFWKKIEEAKEGGIMEREFEKIENFESAIAYHQNKIDEYEEEIKSIKDKARLRLERTGV